MTSAGSTTFHFKAGTPEGELFVGSLAALSEGEALGVLRKGGYQPLQIGRSPIRQPFLMREVSFGGERRLTLTDCESFCRELELLLAAGIDLLDALSLFIGSLPTKSRRRRFSIAIRHWLRMGNSLSQSIVQSNWTCPADFVPVIKAGEETGTLPAAFGTLAKTYGENLRFARLFAGALTYPAFLLITAFAVLVVIALFVAPNLATLFASMERPAPAMIAFLSAAPAQIAGNPGLAVAGAVALAAVGVLVATSKAIRNGLRQLAFATPLLGEVLVWTASRRLATTLRLYLLSNVGIATALPSALAAAAFPATKYGTAALTDAVRRGGRLFAAVEQHARLPDKVVHLLRIGETSGRLPEALAAIAEEASLRVEKSTARLSALLAPVLIVIVGTIIGSIVLSVFTALLDVNDLVAR
jgi:type II secretory pathway component PulF